VLAMAVTPALKRLVTIIEKGEDAQALGAIKEVLARNDLYGLGVEPEGALVNVTRTRSSRREYWASVCKQSLPPSTGW